MKRCSWATQSLILQNYHDQEWGIKQTDERKLFEALSLEIFQAGLSWQTVLQKRENFRDAFDNFDINKVSNYDDDKIKKLLLNKGIIRNKSKILAVINNSKVLKQLHSKDITLKYLTWHQTNYTTLDHMLNHEDTLNNELFVKHFLNAFKSYHFKRVGEKTLYSYLQAIGVINDHEKSCFLHDKINQKNYYR